MEKFSANVRRLNDEGSLYELYRPPGQPRMQIVFFHGLGDDENAHLSTWTSRDGSTIWPQTWLVEAFPYAQVMAVDYKGLLNSGHSDMFLIAENVISDLISEGVGRDPRFPLFLVGHSFGGLVIQEICLKANTMSSLLRSKDSAHRFEAFLGSVKGLFFYSTPFWGISDDMKDIGFFRGIGAALQESMTALSSQGARRNEAFHYLIERYKWPTAGVGETLPTKFGRSRAFMVVPEVSARSGVYSYYNATETDHITVCKPESKLSREFRFLRDFLDKVMQEDYGVGLEEQVHDIQRMLTNVAIIGVVGMGGIGKTTIAKLLFNQISKDFEYTNFVENINSISGDTLEDSILSNFYYQGRKVHPNESTRWYDLKEKKTLIVMDDVRSSEQLSTLPSLNHFGSGSCLIITSRDRAVFESYENRVIYEVDLLRLEDAMKLFCLHAFNQESIPEDLIRDHGYLERNVGRIVMKCQGLPLTIEVMGRYLRYRDSQFIWEQAIDKLGKAESLPGEKDHALWHSLQSSYDSLLLEEQALFIEAATYFYEQPLDRALAAWDSVYGNSHFKWKILLNKSMVKEVQKSTRDFSGGMETQYVAVGVHEQLRDLAKSLSRNRAGTSAENVNWLRANGSSVQLPFGDQEYPTASHTNQIVLPSELLDKYSENLKYLDLDGVMIEQPQFPRKLSLLRWQMGSMSQLPQIAFEDMKDLVVLELANWGVPKKFSDVLGKLVNLHTLQLGQLEGLDSLPTNFGNLSRLKQLQLVDLGLLMLPASFGNLRALEYLTLVNVKISSLPESFEELCSLRELSLLGCTQLERLPDSLGQLSALQRLTIENAHLVEALPESLGMLASLEHLTLVRVNMPAFPESFGKLSSLQELVLHGCTQLERLPDTLGKLASLVTLTIRNCHRLESLPVSLGNLSALDVLVLDGCRHLRRLPVSFGQLVSLRTLRIADADGLEALPESLRMVSSLKHLTLVRVSILAIPELRKHLTLQTVTIRDCEKLECLPLSLKHLHISESLVVEGCVQLERLPNRIEGQSAPQNLTLVNVSILELSESLRKVSTLKHLTLINVRIEELPACFDDLYLLVTLTIRSCSELSSLPQSLGRLSSLKGLYIHNCPKLARLPDCFRHMSSLKELYIYQCPVVRDAAAGAVVQAYSENTGLTADLHIDWNGVSDPSLRTKLELYIEANKRFKTLTAPEEDSSEEDDKAKEQEKGKHESELKRVDTLEVQDSLIQKEVVPRTCAKIFLCGYPKVGKTTLRKTLKRCVQKDYLTKFMMERAPNCIPLPRTRGIEITRIEELQLKGAEKKSAGSSMTLNLWDLAGQEEYHVLHSNFFFFTSQGPARGKATTFVLVFREKFEKGTEIGLRYWLEFVASASDEKRHVVIVLNHFSFQSGISEEHKGRWKYFIDEYQKQFKDRLDIHSDPYMVDVRVASQVLKLKIHLFQHVREQLAGKTMPRLCGEIQEALKKLPAGKMSNILTRQAFEKGLNLKSKGDQFSLAASYLHEMGDIIYFGFEESEEPRSEDKILVVPNPDWFCNQVVGKLLLPKGWLEGRPCQDNPGLISIDEFQSIIAGKLDRDTKPDYVISMLEGLGLCYKVDQELIIPTLVTGDFDYKSNGWDCSKGVDGGIVNPVMGRSLGFINKDKTACAVPITLFRRLQVDLAKDGGLGDCPGSGYTAGKSFSIFRVGTFVVLVQFDEAANNPTDDRIDVLVKSHSRTDSFARHMDYICEVMHKLQRLCGRCYSGMQYDIKVIQPWSASGKDLPMIDRNIKESLEKFRDRVKNEPDGCSSWWPNLKWTEFLSDGEREGILPVSPDEELKILAEQEYDDCNRAAFDMGLVNCLEELNLSEEQEAPEDLNCLEDSQRRLAEVILAGVHSEGRTTRTLIKKSHSELLGEIRNKHELLAKKIQAQSAFLFDQAANDVPRFMFLSKKDGPWIQFLETLGQRTFQLHLLCEADVEKGIAYEVHGQEGITVEVNDDFLRKVEPWVRWSFKVLVTVGKTVGNIYLPGIFDCIPDGWTFLDFVKDNTKLILANDDGSKLEPDGQGNYGTKEKGVGLIAKDVIKGLKEIEERKVPGGFREKTRLRKVYLRERENMRHDGPSQQAQPSVVWICFDCHAKYGSRIKDLE